MTRPARSVDSAIVKVGDGRGFLIDDSPSTPLVVTAAHCLPRLPVPLADDGLIFFPLVGPLGKRPAIGATCVFVDPTADIAVLEAPDGQANLDAAEAYEQFVDGRTTLRIGSLATRYRGWTLALSGKWEACEVDVSGGGHRLNLIGAHIEGGMSGSPILNRNNQAIGVVTCSNEANGQQQMEHHGQPALVSVLPGWLLAKLFPDATAMARIETSKRGWERYLKRSWASARRRLVKQKGDA